MKLPISLRNVILSVIAVISIPVITVISAIFCILYTDKCIKHGLSELLHHLMQEHYTLFVCSLFALSVFAIFLTVLLYDEFLSPPYELHNDNNSMLRNTLTISNNTSFNMMVFLRKGRKCRTIATCSVKAYDKSDHIIVPGNDEDWKNFKLHLNVASEDLTLSGEHIFFTFAHESKIYFESAKFEGFRVFRKNCARSDNGDGVHSVYITERLPPLHNWMKSLPDTTPLNELTIPGTHDSASSPNNFNKKMKNILTLTQHQSLAEQLANGIRFLDIRIRKMVDAFLLHHGPMSLNMGFWQVQNECAKFLTQNPSEVIIMRIKEEFELSRQWYDFLDWLQNGKVPLSFEELLKIKMTYTDTRFNFPSPAEGNLLISERMMYCISSNSRIPLKDIRGKIVLIRNFPVKNLEVEFGIDWQLCNVQDTWNLASILTKTKHCTDHFDQLLLSPADSKLSINFTSANGQYVSPFQMAIGYHVADRSTLWMIIRYSLLKCIPYFSQAADFKEKPFRGINSRICEYLCSNAGRGALGVIVSDFPSDILIRMIISKNYFNVM